MVDIFLVISAVVLSVLILFVCAWLMINFGHPDDKNCAWIPKLVVLFGLYLATATVMVMPFDVSNSRGQGGGLRIDILWQIIFILDAVMLGFILPYVFFYYESDVDPVAEADNSKGLSSTQACSALKYTLAMSVIMLIVLFVMYLLLNEANIPVRQIQQAKTNWVVVGSDPPSFSSISETYRCGEACKTSEISWTVNVTFPIYLVAFLAFLGWFFFALFSGIGLVALPLDLVNEYLTRPTPISTQDYTLKRIELGRRAQRLLEICRQFKSETDDLRHGKDRRTMRKDRQTQNKLENQVYLLKNEYKAIQVAYIERGGNPIWYWFKLLLGILSGILSLTWILHICIYVLPTNPPFPFLNSLFISLERGIQGFPLFGVLAFAFYALYLLWCGIKGVFRFGLRLPWIMKLYPMELDNTLMNAFIFNTWLIILMSIACLQFCATSFPVYARFTEVNVIFGSQVRYLKFFSFFFDNNIFVIVMLSIMALTGIILSMCPRDKSQLLDQKIKAIAKGEDEDY